MKIIKTAAVLLCLVMLWGCSGMGAVEKTDVGNITLPEGKERADATDASASDWVVTAISFLGSEAEINGEGAALEGGVLKITRGGSYALSGQFFGSILVDVTKSEKVELILSGASVSSADTSAIYVKRADKVTLILAKGTENTLVDGEEYAFADDAEPSACIYSADDLDIEGEGVLEIFAKCRNGIQTKNDLRIKGGKITVTAPKNALKGKDSVIISGGDIMVTGAKDGIKSDNEKEEDRGVVKITGGVISLVCQDDGIQAFRSVTVTSGARITVDCGDDAVNCDGETDIAEGAITE